MTFQSPSLIYRLIFKHRGRSTHHKIALSALLNLRGADSAGWQALFLYEAEAYLRGAKAPDDMFRDSINQVLHVGDKYWGGAPEAAENWYARLVERLRARAWADAAFAAGVLSHYYSDPIQPLHTGQTEAEGAIHRALEQSIAKSWDSIIATIDRPPTINVPAEPGWLAWMVKEGAERAHPYYDLCIDHYNLAAGVAQPQAGLDDALRRALGVCIGHAVYGYAAILSRAIADAAVSAPPVNLSIQGVLTALSIPLQTVLKGLEDAEERAIIHEQFAEFLETGKVVRTLSHDDRIVRAAHARDVLRTDIASLDATPARAPGGRHGKPVLAASVGSATSAAPVVATKPPPASATQPAGKLVPPDQQSPTAPQIRVAAPARLPMDAPVEDAPAIGPMTAARLNAIGCITVADMLALDPATAAAKLDVPHIDAEGISRWQAAARLYASIRTLSQTEAHLLAALGITSIEALRSADPAPLADQIAAFAATGEGKRIVRNGVTPDTGDVESWIAASRAAS